MDKITKALIDLGCDPSIKGFPYTKTAIEMFIKAGDDAASMSITKELYPSVGEKYNTTGTRVERSIRHMIENAFTVGTPDKMNEFFGQYLSLDKGKVSNRTFIAVMAENLR